MNTYTHGYNLFLNRDITKDDLVNICRDLNNQFEQKYIFEPEPITDGLYTLKIMTVNINV